MVADRHQFVLIGYLVFLDEPTSSGCEESCWVTFFDQMSEVLLEGPKATDNLSGATHPASHLGAPMTSFQFCFKLSAPNENSRVCPTLPARRIQMSGSSKSDKSKRTSPLISFVAGGVAGGCEAVATVSFVWGGAHIWTRPEKGCFPLFRRAEGMLVDAN